MPVKAPSFPYLEMDASCLVLASALRYSDWWTESSKPGCWAPRARVLKERRELGGGEKHVAFLS